MWAWVYSICAGLLLVYLFLFSLLVVAKRSDERAEEMWREYLNGRK